MRPPDAAHFKLRCTWQRFVGYEAGNCGGRRRYRPPTPMPDPDERPNRRMEERIIQAYREDGRMVLRIDKGATAGVKVGRESLDGGSFKVVKVFEDGCVAESLVKSVGRNNRVLLFLP